MTVAALRTPDERFEGLADWPYAPRYVEDLPGFEGLRLHYIDEGPRTATTFVCLHGEPTWGYLFRRMIPVFIGAGHRVVAPDLFGFGRSDKPRDDAVYTFDFHRTTLMRFVERLGAEYICLVMQDWGGLLGLTLPMEYPARITRLLVMNTALAVGKDPGEGFMAWKAYCAAHPDLEVGKLIKRATPHLTAAEVTAYDAPFPDARYKAGVRRFPELVPLAPEHPGAQVSRRAAKFLSEQWTGESFMAIGVKDPVLGPPVMEALRTLIAGCPEPLRLAEAGHFVQEWGEEIARAALARFGFGGP